MVHRGYMKHFLLPNDIVDALSKILDGGVSWQEMRTALRWQVFEPYNLKRTIRLQDGTKRVNISVDELSPKARALYLEAMEAIRKELPTVAVKTKEVKHHDLFQAANPEEPKA